jgi:hypothetical protein
MAQRWLAGTVGAALLLLGPGRAVADAIDGD